MFVMAPKRRIWLRIQGSSTLIIACLTLVLYTMGIGVRDKGIPIESVSHAGLWAHEPAMSPITFE